MLIIFAILVSGILLGRLLRNKNMKFLPKVITVIIWTLLFSLGVGVGSNPEVMSNLGSLGVLALLIAIFAVAGSIFTTWLLWVYIKKYNRGKEDER